MKFEIGFANRKKTFSTESGPGSEAHNITCIGADVITEEERLELNNLQSAVIEMSEAIRKKFLDDVQAFCTSHSLYSEKIFNHIKEKGLDRPSFDIYTPAEAIKILESFGYTQEIPDVDKDRFLVVFKLPKPVEQFWRKIPADQATIDAYSLNRISVGPSILPWGVFYEDVVNTAWEYIHTIAINEHHIDFERLNPVGVHTKEYYYLWKVGPVKDGLKSDADSQSYWFS